MVVVIIGVVVGIGHRGGNGKWPRRVVRKEGHQGGHGNVHGGWSWRWSWGVVMGNGHRRGGSGRDSRGRVDMGAAIFLSS